MPELVGDRSDEEHDEGEASPTETPAISSRLVVHPSAPGHLVALRQAKAFAVCAKTTVMKAAPDGCGDVGIGKRITRSPAECRERDEERRPSRPLPRSGRGCRRPDGGPCRSGAGPSPVGGEQVRPRSLGAEGHGRERVGPDVEREDLEDAERERDAPA